jgi:hypothetical protein
MGRLQTNLQKSATGGAEITKKDNLKMKTGRKKAERHGD